MSNGRDVLPSKLGEMLRTSCFSVGRLVLSGRYCRMRCVAFTLQPARQSKGSARRRVRRVSGIGSVGHPIGQRAVTGRQTAATQWLRTTSPTPRTLSVVLRYELTAYPFAAPGLHKQMGDLLSLDRTRRSPLLKGPYVSLSRPFRDRAQVLSLVEEGLLLLPRQESQGLRNEDGYLTLVYNMARTLIEEAGRSRSDADTGQNLSDLADPALTLHRIPDDERGWSRPFEGLLKADAPGLSESLKMIDRPAFR